MPTVAIVPIRSFSLGKTRLSGSLSEERRIVLGQRMAEHVTTSAEAVGMLPMIVTGDDDVAEWSLRSALPVIEDPGSGLDAAAAEGIEFARAADSQWVIVHSDLPLLTESDLRLVFDALSDERQPIAPSLDGGTTLVGGRESLVTSYGEASFHRHLTGLDRPTILTTTGLLHDVDSMTGLASAAAHPRGRWLREFL